jgi:hypothetical protein
MVVAVIVLPSVSFGLMPMLASKGPAAMPIMVLVGTGMSLVSIFVISSMGGPGGSRVLYKVWLVLLVLRMLRWHF